MTAAYYLSKTSITAHLHVGLLTSNGPTSCAVQQDASQPGSLTAVTFDFTSCKARTPADFNGNAIKVDVGAHQVGSGSLTFYLDYVRIQVTYSAPGGFDPTHLSRTYYDGLGRPVREVAMDLYGHTLTTTQTMGWNDQPAVSYATTGQFTTTAYDFESLATSVVGPPVNGVSSVTEASAYPSFRQVQTTDPDGRLSFAQTDLLGRVVYQGVRNPAVASGFPAGFNYTVTAYDALGLATSVSVYAGTTLLQTTTYYYNAAGLPVYELYPDGTNQTRTYDGDLRLSTVVDAMGHVATYAYASSGNGTGMGWLAYVQIRANAASTTCYETAYTYDVLGDTTEIDNGTAQVCGSGAFYYTSELITRSYDALRRLESEVTSAGTTITYGYDNASRVTSIAYPGSQGTVYYAYDSLGRPSQVYWGGTAPSDLYATVAYDAYGRLSTIAFDQAGTSTGIAQTYAYDAANRITEVKVASSSTGYMDLVYTYDTANLVTSISDNMYPGGVSSPKTDTLAYDGNGRLASALGPFSMKALVGGDNQMAYLNYSYDALGNVLQRQDSDLGACAQSCIRWDTGQTVTYNYAGAYDQLTSSSGKVVESFAYNGLGSMTSRSGSSYAYDLQQRLIGVTTSGGTWTYYKDGVGRTEEEVGPSYDVWYAYLADGRLAYQYNQTSGVKSSYVYLGNQILFRKDSTSASVHFYAMDLSNNVRLVWSYASGSATVELKQRYEPFGEAATPLATSSTDPRFKFAEQSYSASTKLYAMGARSYAPDLGRFTSRDPVGGHGYAYAADNPMSFWDPSGRDVWSTIGGFLQTLWNDLTSPGIVPPSYHGPGAAPGTPSTMTSGHAVAEWWNGLSPGTQHIILVVGVVAVVSFLTFGIADLVAAPVLSGIAGAGAALSGGLATVADWLGGSEWEGAPSAGAADATGAAGDLLPALPSSPLTGIDAANGGSLLDDATKLANFDSYMLEWNLDVTLQNWDFFDEPYPDTSAQTLGQFMESSSPNDVIPSVTWRQVVTDVIRYGPWDAGAAEAAKLLLQQNPAYTRTVAPGSQVSSMSLFW